MSASFSKNSVSLKRSITMTISLKDITRSHELTAGEVEPVMANVKYAQRNDVEIEPVVANVKYAQRNDAEVEPVMANVKYAQRNDEEVMAIVETA